MNFYRDDVYDTDESSILERYKAYNGMEGNSYTTEMSDTANAAGYPTLGSNNPDIEDLLQLGRARPNEYSHRQSFAGLRCLCCMCSSYCFSTGVPRELLCRFVESRYSACPPFLAPPFCQGVPRELLC